MVNDQAIYSTLIHFTLFVCMSVIGFLPIGERLIIALISVIYTLGYGLRESFGNDYYQYLENFIYVNSVNDGGDIFFEPTYVLLSKLSWIIFGVGGSLLVFCLYSALVIVVFLMAMRSCGLLKLGIPLFYSSGFIFFANNQIRQALAVAIFLWILPKLEGGKGKMVYVVPISVLLHISSVVQYVLAFIPKFKVNVLTVLLIYSLALFSSNMMSFLDGALLFVNFIPVYGEAYSARLIQTFEMYYEGTGFVVIYLALTYITITLTSIKTRYDYVGRIFMVGSVLYLVFIKIDLVERVFYPFTFLSILLVGWSIVGPVVTKIRKISGGIILAGNTFLVFFQSLLEINKHGTGPFNHLFWTL